MSTTRSAFVAVLFLLAGMTNAFAPVNNPSTVATATTNTALQFGFLKDLGIEKPSWLPDFGGKKEEAAEVPAPAEETEGEESSQDEAASEEE